VTGIDPESGKWQTDAGRTDGIGSFDTASVVEGLQVLQPIFRL
jgi:hypothetical protein